MKNIFGHFFGITVFTMVTMAAGPAQVSARGTAPSPEELGTEQTDTEKPWYAREGAFRVERENYGYNLGAVLDATYEAGDHTSDQASLRAFEVDLGGHVDDRFYLKAVLNFTPEEVAVEEAYAQAVLPWNFQAQYGRQLVPFGDLNTYHGHDVPQIDRPQVLTRHFGDEGLNAIGGHLEWNAPFAKNPTLTILGGAYNRAVGEDDDGDGFLDGTVFNVMDGGTNIRRGPLWLARGATFYEWGQGRNAIRAGVSYLQDKNDNQGVGTSSVWGADVKYRWTPDASGRGVTIAGEYLQHEREERHNSALFLNGGQDFKTDGLYAYGQYDFNRNWGVGYRYDRSDDIFESTGNGVFRVGNRITSNSGYLEWRPSEFSRLRLQYRHDSRNYDGNNAGVRGDDDNNVIMLQATHMIGWHPAHKF